MKDKYQIAIIGAGTAGLAARHQIAKTTDDYLVIDPGPLGTTCARVGCMPSKAFLHLSKKKQCDSSKASFTTTGNNLKTVLKEVREHRDYFVGHVKKGISKWETDHLIQAQAQFLDKNTLLINDQKVRFETIIIATGSTPIIPKEWEPYSDFLLTTDHFFEQEILPSKLAVVGLGPVGLEIGESLKRLGFDVLGINRSPKLGGLTSPQLQKLAHTELSKHFPIHIGDAKPIKIQNNQIFVEIENKTQIFDLVLMSVGRKPNISELGLENIGIKIDTKGLPVFDETNFRIQNTSIYISGDANGVRPILHEAENQGKIVGHHAIHGERPKYPQDNPRMSIVFSSPQICQVGQTHSMLTENKTDFITGFASFENQGRSLIESKNQGGLEVYIDKKSQKFLGSEMFCHNGEHFSHMLAWIIKLDVTLTQVLDLPFYHPTFEEGVKSAFKDAQRRL